MIEPDGSKIDTFVVTNIQLLKIIVHNLLDNANKFTDNGIIKAFVSKDSDRLSLVIEDSGRGISQELLEWFKSGSALPSESSSGGIGLTMVRQLAPSITENIRMERLNPGTRVIMTFPAFS